MAITPIPAVNPATIEKLVARSFRTLDQIELATATVLLEDAWYMLIGYKPEIEAQLSVSETNPLVDDKFKHNVMRLIINSVLRVVNNPEGILEEEGDDYRYRKDSAVSTGQLYMSEAEITGLWPEKPKGAWTIKPGVVQRARRALRDEDMWQTLL